MDAKARATRAVDRFRNHDAIIMVAGSYSGTAFPTVAGSNSGADSTSTKTTEEITHEPVSAVTGANPTPPSPQGGDGNPLNARDCSEMQNSCAPPSVESEMIGAAKAVGYALAERGYTILVGIPELEKVQSALSWYVLNGAEQYWRDQQGFKDDAAFQAALKDKKVTRHRVIFYRPKMSPEANAPELEQKSLNKNYPCLECDTKPNSRIISKLHTQFTQHIGQVDGAILIGGSEGTGSIGYAVYAKKRPVIPLARFGGAARDIYEDVLSFSFMEMYDAGKIKQDPDICEQKWVGEECNGKPHEDNLKAGRQVVDLLDQVERELTSSSNYATNRVNRLVYFSLALFVAWCFFFTWLTTSGDILTRTSEVMPITTPMPTVVLAATAVPTLNETLVEVATLAPVVTPTTVIDAIKTQAEVVTELSKAPRFVSITITLSSPQFMFWVLLVISSMMGTSLRIFVALGRAETSISVRLAYERTFLWVTYLVPVLIAYALALIYFYAGMTFSNSLPVSSMQADKYGPVALYMSLIGFTAGLFVPMDRLNQILENTMFNAEYGKMPK